MASPIPNEIDRSASIPTENDEPVLNPAPPPPQLTLRGSIRLGAEFYNPYLTGPDHENYYISTSSSYHYVPAYSLLLNYQHFANPMDVVVKTPNSNSCDYQLPWVTTIHHALGRGDLHLPMYGSTLKLEDTLLVPTLNWRIVSVKALLPRKIYRVTDGGGVLRIAGQNRPVGFCEKYKGLLKLIVGDKVEEEVIVETDMTRDELLDDVERRGNALA